MNRPRHKTPSIIDIQRTNNYNESLEKGYQNESLSKYKS